MSLIDVELPAPTATDGAIRCRKAFREAVDSCEHVCEEVRRMVQQYGRPQIAAALGDDAAELPTLYATLKSVVEQYGRSVEDLPGG